MISVIVPVYGVEAYLDKCVRSIVTQTYRDLEIILVDDESPDNCPAMCDAWAQKDPRIRVLHNRHGGLSDARNKGLEASSGEFIIFVDSDDFLAPEHCEKLLAAQRETDADIVIGNLACLPKDGGIVTCNFPFTKQAWTFSGREILSLLFPKSGSPLPCGDAAWNRLYRRGIFMGNTPLRYPVGKTYEDGFVSYKAYFAARTVTFISDVLYFYVRREGSITDEMSLSKLGDYFARLDDMLDWLQNKDTDTILLMEHALYLRYFAILGSTLLLANRQEADSLGRHYWGLLRSSTSPYLKNPKAGLLFKIKYVLHSIHLLTPLMRIKLLLVGIIKRTLKAVGLFEAARALRCNPRLALHPGKLFACR
jgi:glycosyltransferase involved in cell wall biosynthesis